MGKFLGESALRQLRDNLKERTVPGSNIPLIIGTQTASSHTWTGRTSAFSELTDGMMINYYLPFAGNGTSVTLELILADGSTTGAIPVYHNNTTRMTTHQGQYMISTLIYRPNGMGSVTTPGWWWVYGRDVDTFDRLYYNNSIFMSAALYRYKWVMQDINGKWYPMFPDNKTSTTAVGSWVPSTASFRIGSPILYYNTTATVASGSTTNNLYRTIAHEVRYNLDVSAVTAYEPILLKGIIDSSGGFVINQSEYFTQAFPAADDGYYYMWIGYAYSTTAVRLDVDHPIYYYKSGKLSIYAGDYVKKAYTWDDLRGV